MTYNEILQYMIEHPDEVDAILKQFPEMRDLWRVYQTSEAAKSGQASYNDVYASYGGNVTPTPEVEKYLDNEIARENTIQAQQQEEHIRDTNVTSTGSQLQQLGLSPSSVVQTGFTSANGVGAAATSHSGAAALHQQARINQFNQKMGLAKSLISAAGSMASSGIYGAALGSIKHSAASMASATAHSGLQIAKSWSGKVNGKFTNWPNAGNFGGNNIDGYLI